MQQHLIEDLKQEWADTANNPAHDQRLKEQLILVHKLFERLHRVGS